MSSLAEACEGYAAATAAAAASAAASVRVLPGQPLSWWSLESEVGSISVSMKHACARRGSFDENETRASSMVARKAVVCESNVTILQGEAALFILGYERNSSVVPSDSDRLISGYRLIHIALYRDTALFTPPYIGIPPYSDRLASRYRLIQTALLGDPCCVCCCYCFFFSEPAGRREKRFATSRRLSSFRPAWART